jgi:hypothetical protein
MPSELVTKKKLNYLKIVFKHLLTLKSINMLDKIKIRDCVLSLVNESAFYISLKSYNKWLDHRIEQGNFNEEKAVDGLQKLIYKYYRDCLNDEVCRRVFKYRPVICDLNKAERIEVAKGIIENFLIDSSYIKGLQGDYQNWKNSDNVEEIDTNVFLTQCTQWSKKIRGQKNLFEFYVKEYY